MRNYVYTLWTKPWIFKKNIYYNLLYFLLSIELVQKHAKTIEIYTDSFGQELFKHILNKDVAKINTNLETFKNLNVYRWSVPKLYTMNHQKSEFCHIDHDVFLFKKIPLSKNIDFIAQCLEKNDNYKNFYKHLSFHYLYHNNNIPKPILEFIFNKKNNYRGFNCGYLDFYNIDVCKEWTNFALNLNNIYTNNFRGIDNVFIEQFSLYMLSKKNKYIYKTLFDFENKDDYNYNKLGYTHLMTLKHHLPNETFLINMIKNKIETLNSKVFENLKKTQKLLNF
jgi:hypothetical protein